MTHDPDLLRAVSLGDTGYTLYTWDTERRFPTGQSVIRYKFLTPAGDVLFEGEDYGCSPMDATDSDDCLRGLVNCLTLRPGDTDSEYFDRYTPEQLAFTQGDAEMLQWWGIEAREFTREGQEPPPFLDLALD